MKKVFFVTGNQGKVSEASQKFSEIKIKLVQKNLGYPEIQTDNLEEVADFGLDHVSKQLSPPFILEDAGLFIDSLNGFPGVYSAYVYQTIGCEGILKLLKNHKSDDRKAVFKSVYALKSSDGEKFFFVGESNGLISHQMKGDNGFGYDPIFVPNASDKTFAEMDISEKNLFSHRGKALNKLLSFLKQNL